MNTVKLKTIHYFIITILFLNFYQIKNEEFTVFISNFNKDFKFQKSRVKFPLKISHTEIGESNEEYYWVNNKEWKCEKIIDNSNKKIVTKIVKKTDGTMGVRRAIYDTGLQVEYVFNRIKGKWFLVKIIDEST